MRRNPTDFARIKAKYEEQILDGAARMLWLLAYLTFTEHNGRCAGCEQMIYDFDGAWVDDSEGDACDETDSGVHERDDDFWPTVGSGEDVDDVAPETPAAARKAAKAMLRMIEQVEGMPITELFELAATIHLGAPFEWFEDGNEPSEKKRKQREKKLELAYEFGEGLAGQAADSGLSWADHHKTRRDGAVFEPELPMGEFTIDGFDQASYSWRPRTGADRLHAENLSLSRRIRISFEMTTPESVEHGDVAERGWVDEEGTLIDGSESGFDDFIHHAVDFLETEGGRSLEPSSSSFSPGDWYVEIDGRTDYRTGAETRRSFHLDGFTEQEEAWIHALYTGKIGSIWIANEPWSSEAYEPGRPDGDAAYHTNYLFRFGEAMSTKPTYVLVFGSDAQSALDEAIDFMERPTNAHRFKGLFADDEQDERYQELVREACDERGVPDEKMLGQRLLDKLHDESMRGYVTGGDAGSVLREDEVSFEQNKTYEELAAIGAGDRLVRNPSPMEKIDASRAAYEAKITARREARMPTCSCPDHDQNVELGEGCACPRSCPGWAVFETGGSGSDFYESGRDLARARHGEALAIQPCDECNSIAQEMGLPEIDASDVKDLPDARVLLRARMTGDSRTLQDQRERGRRRGRAGARRCDFCGASGRPLVARLAADPDQRVCATCAADPRINVVDNPSSSVTVKPLRFSTSASPRSRS